MVVGEEGYTTGGRVVQRHRRGEEQKQRVSPPFFEDVRAGGKGNQIAFRLPLRENASPLRARSGFLPIPVSQDDPPPEPESRSALSPTTTTSR
jgi:hypothetical protein